MNANELVTAIRRAGQLSANDPNYTDPIILEEASQALIDRFAEPVTTLRQGYWLQRMTQSTSPANTSGMYRLPPRAVVQGLELLEVSSDDGASWRTLNIKTHGQSVASGPGYVLEGDCIRLVSVDYPCRFRMRYYLRPPVLTVFESQIPRVVSFTNTSITVDYQGDLWQGALIDAQSPDGSHELSVVDALIEDIEDPGDGAVTLNLVNPIDTSRILPGDYVTSADQANFPMLPRELHRPLADYVAGAILMSKGDNAKGSVLIDKAERGITRIVSMAQPRIKTAPFTWKRNSYLRGMGR